MNRVYPAVEPERRVIASAPELRAEAEQDGLPRRLVGYAAVFDKPALIGKGKLRFRERIAPGAFTKTIQEADVRLLVNHDPSPVLARTKNGTLRLAEDDIGLRVEAHLDVDNPDVVSVVRQIARGDVDQMSFAFDVIREEWNMEVDPPERVIREVRLWDVSVVTFPAYKETTVHVRMDDRIQRELEARGVVPTDVSRETAPEDTPWERPNLSDFTDKPWDELTESEKRRIAGHFAWAASMPPETYGDLKLPHHDPGTGAVVWRAVAAAMAALLGARGGVDIPSADRRRVYEHLASHYRQFDREPPEFSAMSWYPAPRAGEEPPVEPDRTAPVTVNLRRSLHERMIDIRFPRGGSTMDMRALYERAQNLYHQMREILDAAANEVRDLTAEELQRYRTLEQELDTVLAQRQALQSRERIERILAEAVPASQGAENPEERAFLRYLRGEGLAPEELRALGKSAGASGGYLVPQTMAREFVKIIDQYSAIRQIVRPFVTDSGEDVLIPVVDDTTNKGVIVAENDVTPEQDTAFAQKRLAAYKYSSKLVRISLELLQDSAFPVDRIITELLGERIGRAIEEHYVVGTGTGQPEGIVTAAPVGKTAAATNAITYDDLVDLVHSLEPTYRANAVFLLHDSTVQAIRKLKDANQQPLWQPSLRDVAPGTILGYPYVTSRYMPTMAANAVAVVFGDMRAAYVVRDVRGIEVVRSDHEVVTRYQMLFSAFFRTGGVVQAPKAITALKMAAA